MTFQAASTPVGSWPPDNDVPQYLFHVTLNNSLLGESKLKVNDPSPIVPPSTTEFRDWFISDLNRNELFGASESIISFTSSLLEALYFAAYKWSHTADRYAPEKEISIWIIDTKRFPRHTFISATKTSHKLGLGSDCDHLLERHIGAAKYYAWVGIKIQNRSTKVAYSRLADFGLLGLVPELIGLDFSGLDKSPHELRTPSASLRHLLFESRGSQSISELDYSIAKALALRWVAYTEAIPYGPICIFLLALRKRSVNDKFLCGQNVDFGRGLHQTQRQTLASHSNHLPELAQFVQLVNDFLPIGAVKRDGPTIILWDKYLGNLGAVGHDDSKHDDNKNDALHCNNETPKMPISLFSRIAHTPISRPDEIIKPGDVEVVVPKGPSQPGGHGFRSTSSCSNDKAINDDELIDFSSEAPSPVFRGRGGRVRSRGDGRGGFRGMGRGGYKETRTQPY